MKPNHRTESPVSWRQVRSGKDGGASALAKLRSFSGCVTSKQLKYFFGIVCSLKRVRHGFSGMVNKLLSHLCIATPGGWFNFGYLFALLNMRSRQHTAPVVH